MQVHNSADTLTRCLEPFLKERIKNFLLFANACLDGSAQLAINKLKAKFHFVMNCNQLQEIHNYRLALSIASHLGCKYVILLQDDDCYSCSRLWIESALIRLNADPSIAILGMWCVYINGIYLKRIRQILPTMEIRIYRLLG